MVVQHCVRTRWHRPDTFVRQPPLAVEPQHQAAGAIVAKLAELQRLWVSCTVPSAWGAHGAWPPPKGPTSASLGAAEEACGREQEMGRRAAAELAACSERLDLSAREASRLEEENGELRREATLAADRAHAALELASQQAADARADHGID